MTMKHRSVKIMLRSGAALAACGLSLALVDGAAAAGLTDVLGNLSAPIRAVPQLVFDALFAMGVPVGGAGVYSIYKSVEQHGSIGDKLKGAAAVLIGGMFLSAPYIAENSQKSITNGGQVTGPTIQTVAPGSTVR